MNEDIYEVRDRIVENKAFLSRKDIRKVKICRGAGYIGDWAFAKCSNLKEVVFEDDFHPGLFGKDVFTGCEKLSTIAFANTDESTNRLLAVCTNKMYYDHLLRADDVGKKSWYGKWDISLISQLKTDDAEARMSAALCGEEDISYDGIGSVDGELPGETDDYVRKEEFRKCSLCYLRLTYDIYLTDMTRETICDHLINNSLGNRSGASFYSLFEDSNNSLEYMRIYLDTIKPDREMITDMIGNVPSHNVVARSYLIKEAEKKSDVLSDLLL